MTRFRICPSKLSGTIAIPPSKSHTLRAILFAALAKGSSEIDHYLHSPDATAMIEAMRLFGAQIEISQEKLIVQGLNGKLAAAENVIDSGNSGQVLRFVGALSALSPYYTILTGDHSIRHNRPVKPLLEALQQLGAFAVSSRNDDYAPILIKGPMHSGHTSLSGEDSQPVSALLIATAFLKGTTTIEVINPGEKPWIDLTLFWLHRFGIQVSHQNYTHYTVKGHAHIDGFSLKIPGDLSSASFPIAAALVTNSELTLKNVDLNDCQGDKKLIEVLIEMGANVEIDEKNQTLTIKKNSRLQGMKIDVNDFIDATPILAVISCFAEGTTEIFNAQIARQKESDRLLSIATELKKMGAQIEERPDGLLITSSQLKGAHLKSYHDHRIAMALTIASLGSHGESQIDGVECIAKTYPDFAYEFKKLGAHIEVL